MLITLIAVSVVATLGGQIFAFPLPKNAPADAHFVACRGRNGTKKSRGGRPLNQPPRPSAHAQI